MGNERYPLRRVRVRGRSGKSTHQRSDNNLNSFMPQFPTSCIHSSSGGSWYSYPHIGVRHEDSSFIHHVSAYYSPFTICFKTKYMTLFFFTGVLRNKIHGTLLFTGEYHRSSNVQNLKRWNNTLYWPEARDLQTHSCPRAFFFSPPRSPWVTCWDHWWCHFDRRWKFCFGGGGGEIRGFHSDQNTWLYELHFSL